VFYKVPFTKVDDGEIRAPGGRSFIVDGNNIYAAVVRHQFNTFAADQVTSTDGGVTWGAAHQMGIGSPRPISPLMFRLALSPDLRQPGKKLLHAIWIEAATGLLNYQYSHPGQGDWSVPITATGFLGKTQSSLVADSNSGVHVIDISVNNDAVIYSHTTVAGAAFSAPVTIATNVNNSVFALSALEIDAQNNLYLVVSAQPELKLLKKVSGSSTWQPFTITADGGNAVYSSPSLVVIDSTHLAVAYGYIPIVNGVESSPSELRFAYSNDAGLTWTRRTVQVDAQVSGHYLAMGLSTENGRQILTLASSTDLGHLSIFRTDDLFATSSLTSMTLPSDIPYIGVDGNGRTLLMVSGFNPSSTIFPNSAVYFLREYRP